MSRPVHVCGPNDNLERAAQLMWDHDLGSVPVVGEQGELVGMITDRDVCMAAYTQGKALSGIQVRTAMASEVFSCRPNESIEVAQRLMSSKRVHRVPVVDEAGRPIGLVSINDIARRAAQSEKGNGLNRGVVQTLASICAPRPQSLQRTGEATAFASRAQPRA